MKVLSLVLDDLFKQMDFFELHKQSEKNQWLKKKKLLIYYL